MKKALSLLLAGSMVFSLAACGGSKDNADTTTDSTAASSDAAGSDTFKIGATGPITGGAAIYGNAVKNGIQIAVDEINAGRRYQADIRSTTTSRMTSMTLRRLSTLTTT